MKIIKLDPEENQILQDFDKDEFIELETIKDDLNKYAKYAQQTLSKAKNINIRLSGKDLQKIKTRAAQTGLPYQTLISSILHQYADGKISVSL